MTLREMEGSRKIFVQKKTLLILTQNTGLPYIRKKILNYSILTIFLNG